MPEIVIEHDDVLNSCMCKEFDTQKFAKGKSCLFALESKLLERPVTSFPLLVTVKKHMPFDVLPDVIAVGSRVVQLRGVISSLFDDVKNNVDNPMRGCQDSFHIKTDTGQKVS